MIDPTDAEYQQDLEDEYDIIGTGIQVSVLLVIVKRLAKSEGKTIAEVFAEIPEDMAKIKQILEAGAAVYIDKAIREIDKMADANDEWAKPFYDARKVKQVNHADHTIISKIVENAKYNTKEAIESICDPSVIGFAVKDLHGYKCIGFEDAYKLTIQKAITAMSSGEASYQSAISEAITGLSNYGIRVMYPSGYTMELPAAARMDIMNGYRQEMSRIRRQQGKEFGADGYEVSVHSPCADDHIPLQGRQISYKDWESEQPPRPIEGINCKHTASPIILGVSSPAYTKEQIEEMNADSEKLVTYIGLDGKQHTSTKYEATQYQRRIERRCRQLDTRETLYKASGDSEAANKARNDYISAKNLYNEASKEMGLTTRDERTKAYIMK